MMTLDWTVVQSRYRVGASLAPLAGDSKLTVTLEGDDAVCVQQRLWRALIARQDLETALVVLDETPKPVTAIEFAERLRAYYTSTTDCSRIPNLSAVLLLDLGYLPAS
jgi:hypothetical protein